MATIRPMAECSRIGVSPDAHLEAVQDPNASISLSRSITKEKLADPEFKTHGCRDWSLSLLARQHGSQKPEFGFHFRGIGHGIGDLLAKEFTIPLAKPVNR